MVDETPESPASFYQWANDRYRRRATSTTWALVAAIVIAALILTLLMNDLRQLRAENQATRDVVRALEAETDELSQRLRIGDNRNARFARCINERNARFQEGLRMLLRFQISSEKFLAQYRNVDCTDV